MTAPAHRKPWPYWIVDRVGAALWRRGLPVAELDAQELLARASRQTGLGDFGDPRFLDGLQVLLQSARDDAKLHLIGRLAMRRLVATALENRLRLQQHKTLAPTLASRPLRPPLIVTGLPRSGTTFLHRLLAQDPASRAVPAWELLRPVAPPRADRRRAMAARQMRLIHAFAPWADQIHETHPDAPEECMLLFISSFQSVLFWAVAPVYGYLRWLLEQDARPAYRDYRIQLQILGAVAPERRLVLKAPTHTAHLATLAEIVPEAKLIQCHRDPVQSVVSVNSLFRAAHGILSDQLDVRRMARANVELLADTASRNRRDRERPTVRVHDVDYRELTRQPLEVVQRIYQRFGLPWSESLAHRLRAFIRDNPKHKHGAHRYRAEDFGLSAVELAERFADYRQAFGFAS